jgi:hypothetical protein
VKTTVKAVSQQVTGNFQQSEQAANTSEQNLSQINKTQQAASDQKTKVLSNVTTRDVIESFYAPTASEALPSVDGSGKPLSEFVKRQIASGKNPDEAMQLEKVRQQLHEETYYIPLTKRKTEEEELKEKEEEEKEEKKLEALQLEEQKKKDQDIALQQAQQRTEKFPGVSG